jgi:hypothetical protein
MSAGLAKTPRKFSTDSARGVARRLETDNPLWIVVFGVYSKEFVCFPDSLTMR